MAVASLTVLSLFATAVPANADSESTATIEVSQEHIREGEALANSTSGPDERLFDADAARELGASEGAIADYALVLEAYGWVTAGSVDFSAATEEGTSAAALARACSGASGYTGYFVPIGYQFALNSCQTSQLIAIMGVIIAGGGLASGIALLTGVGVPAGAAGGILVGIAAVGTAFLAVCQAFSSNGGIYVNSGGLVPPSCWGQ